MSMTKKELMAEVDRLTKELETARKNEQLSRDLRNDDLKQSRERRDKAEKTQKVFRDFVFSIAEVREALVRVRFDALHEDVLAAMTSAREAIDKCITKEVLEEATRDTYSLGFPSWMGAVLAASGVSVMFYLMSRAKDFAAATPSATPPPRLEVASTRERRAPRPKRFDLRPLPRVRVRRLRGLAGRNSCHAAQP